MTTTKLLLLTTALLLALATGVRAQVPDLPGDIEPLSTTQLKCYNSGSGANTMKVCISDHGNVVKFESPSGFDQIGQANTFRDGYAICTGSLPDVPNVPHGYDTGGIEGGFGPATVVTLSPLTILRDTTDGIFRLKQVFKRDTKEKELTIEMTVTNLTTSDQEFVKLQRAFEGDIDNNSSTNMWFGRSTDSAFAWVDQPAAGSPPNGHGLMLTAVTKVPGATSAVNTIADYNPIGTGQKTANGCIVFFAGKATPVTPAQDLVGRVIYGLGTIPAGGSSTVVFKYTRF